MQLTENWINFLKWKKKTVHAGKNASKIGIISKKLNTWWEHWVNLFYTDDKSNK